MEGLLSAQWSNTLKPMDLDKFEKFNHLKLIWSFQPIRNHPIGGTGQDMPDWQLVLPRWSRRATFAAARAAPDTDSATMKAAVWPISKRSLGMSTEGGEDWPNWWRAEHIWRQYEDIARTILEKTSNLVISCHFYTVILYHSVILLQISRYRFSPSGILHRSLRASPRPQGNKKR